MSTLLSIPADHTASASKTNTFVVMLAIAILISTFLRISLMIIYPLVVLFIAVFFRYRITASFLILFGLASFSFLLSLAENWFFKYKLLSLFYMLPFLLLLFSRPGGSQDARAPHLPVFMKCLAIVAIINDLIGIAQVIRTPDSDDSFVGIYSEYSVSLNGLMLLNTILFYYYFIRFINYRKTIYIILTLFFLCCAILGFYGAGLIISIAAFILSFFRFQLSAVLRTLAIGLVSLAAIYSFMLYVKPLTLEYNIANMKKIVYFDPAYGPRKVKAFYNYAVSYPKNAKDLLFGSGPGTFNSRSAFMVGSPTYFQSVRFIKDDEQPYYFKNFAYTLWNEGNTMKALFLDGFRNQPFSSILAFLGEYGLIFTLAFFWLYLRYYSSVARLYRYDKSDMTATIYFMTFRFLMILLPLLLLVDNFFEYPEMMLLIILGIKFAHTSLLAHKQNLSAP